MRLKDIYWRKHEEGWHRTPVRPLQVEAGEPTAGHHLPSGAPAPS
jgi:hypothetical protein